VTQQSLGWLTADQVRALHRGRIPALTLDQLIVLRFLKQVENEMVAKVAGFGGFVGIVKQFMDPEWDDMGASMLEIGTDLEKEKQRAKDNISAARAGVDQLRAFNNAFGNGPPSSASSPSPAPGAGANAGASGASGTGNPQ